MITRTLIVRIHLWIGASVGLLLVCAGLTGSVLVFRPQIDAWLHPELLHTQPTGQRVGVEQAVAAVRAAYPREQPLRVQLPRGPEETYEVTLAGAEGRQVWVDPYRGTVLGSRLPTELFTGWLFELHTSLLAGETGETVMGVAALLLLVLVATGVVVWWPGLRRLGDRLRVNWGAKWKRINWDVHGAGGIWSSVFLVVVAVTGASLVFHEAFLAGLNGVTRSAPRPQPPAVEPLAGTSVLSLDAVIQRAERALPGGETTYLTLPDGPTAAFVVRKRFPEELHPNGRNFIYLHPQSGEVLAVESALAAPAGTRAYNVLYPVHIGRWGGWFSRILYALLGLSPLALSVSGGLIWWNRTRPQRRRRSSAPRRAAGAERAVPPLRKRRPAALLLLLAAASAGCATTGATSAPESAWVERETYLMGTTLRAVVGAPDAAAGAGAIEAAFREVRRLEDVLSSWRDDSEIGRVNAAAPGTPVPVSAELVDLLRETEPWVAATSGAFDPTVGALVDAWDLRGEGRRPAPDELARARRATGWGGVRVDAAAGTVTRSAGGSWIDTGGFGKGAALRAAGQVLTERGVRAALLDFGGQLLVIGCPPATAVGSVAVSHPVRRSEPAVPLRLCDRSASTTSDAERFVDVGGERLGHVLDPRSGRPAPAWGSVTVVADDALVADVLSTALFVLGPDEGLNWARGRSDFGALFLWEEGGVTRAASNQAMAEFLAEDGSAGGRAGFLLPATQ